jgi:hypothetical protein
LTDFHTTGHRSIDHCNFYDNDCQSEGLFYSRTSYGLKVSYCVFNGNSNPLFAVDDFDNDGYVVSNCVFSDDMTWDTVFSLTYSNEVNTVTASLALSDNWFADCRTATPSEEFTSAHGIYQIRHFSLGSACSVSFFMD